MSFPPPSAPSPRDGAHADRDRHGFTLAELVVALVLLTIGLLALASTSAFLAYEHAASGRAERAALIAASRLDRLRSGVCAATRGTEIVEGLTVGWSVEPAGRAALAEVRVTWLERGRTVAQHYSGGFPC